MHMPTLPAENQNLMKDRLSISWLALNKRGALQRFQLTADQVNMDLNNGSCICRPLPEGMNPSLQTVLVTVAHPGVKYDNAYSSRGEMHSPKEAVLGWIWASVRVELATELQGERTGRKHRKKRGQRMRESLKMRSSPIRRN
jgi:hypothetical protein